MKLLILTQKVDVNDDVLGFFHNWIEEFAKHCEQIIVVCLQRGKHNLPKNVRVLSLGKEEFLRYPRHFRFLRRLVALFRFYRYILGERSNYDKVFVHMNQEYVILGGLLWKMWGKKVFFWRNHPKGGFFTDLAVLLADKVFCTSKFSYTARFAKTELMPAGVETDYFINLNYPAGKERINLLFLGRISLIKDLETLIKSLAFVRKESKKIFLNIVGAASEKDKQYLKRIKNLIAELKLEEYVKFWGKTSHKKTLEFYNKNDIFINLTRSGSLDKTTLEAMSCEKLVLVCNKSFIDIFPSDWQGIMIFREKDAKDLAEKIIKIANLERNEKGVIERRGRELVVRSHSLNSLVNNIFFFLK